MTIVAQAIENIFKDRTVIGDGDTDIPCMRLVREQGGHSIAVYRPKASRKKAEKLIADKRAGIASANYSPGKSLDQIVKAIIEKVAYSETVRTMKRSS